MVYHTGLLLFWVHCCLSSHTHNKLVSLWVNSRVHQAYSVTTLVLWVTALDNCEMLPMIRAFSRPDRHLSPAPPLWSYRAHSVKAPCFKGGWAICDLQEEITVIGSFLASSCPCMCKQWIEWVWRGCSVDGSCWSQAKGKNCAQKLWTVDRS